MFTIKAVYSIYCCLTINFGFKIVLLNPFFSIVNRLCCGLRHLRSTKYAFIKRIRAHPIAEIGIKLVILGPTCPIEEICFTWRTKRPDMAFIKRLHMSKWASGFEGYVLIAPGVIIAQVFTARSNSIDTLARTSNCSHEQESY